MIKLVVGLGDITKNQYYFAYCLTFVNAFVNNSCFEGALDVVSLQSNYP